MRSRYGVEGSIRNFQNADSDCIAFAKANDVWCVADSRSALSAASALAQETERSSSADRLLKSGGCATASLPTVITINRTLRTYAPTVGFRMALQSILSES